MYNKEFIFTYNDQRIPYVIWFTESSDEVRNIVFLGTVQIGEIPKWVAEHCPPKTAVVQGAPHWFAKADGSDIPEFMFGFTRDAVDSILACKKVVSLRIIADSQAVPGVVSLFLAAKYSRYMQSMALLQPLGFTKNVFNGSSEQRMAMFKKRVMRNVYRQIPALLTDYRLRYNHRLLAKTVNLNTAHSAAQYNSGISYDAIPDLQKLYEVNQNITIICGADDMIFPAGEIESNLHDAQIPILVETIKHVPHSPLATRLGLKLLHRAFERLD